MSDCQRCAALRMIAEDATLSIADMVQLARDALRSQITCSRPIGRSESSDVNRIAMLPELSYNQDNPILDVLLPAVLKRQVEI